MTTTDPAADTATQLADALAEIEARQQREADPHAIIETCNWAREAAALLPVVDRIARHRAADELDRAATEAEPWQAVGNDALRARAAALRAEP